MNDVSIRTQALKPKPSAGPGGTSTEENALRAASVDPADDIVDRASNDSFPASDAPAWINGNLPAVRERAIDGSHGIQEQPAPGGSS